MIAQAAGVRRELPRLRVVLLLLLLSAALEPRAWAHPGVGLVRDHQGNVYYTDLAHVWRITPAGVKSVVVRNVHTHELAIDTLGNLYVEDNRYLGSGEGDDRYRHRIWRRSPSGVVTDVVPWRAGFWREYGFARDPEGTMYWVQCPARRCSIRGRTASGTTRLVGAAPGGFRHPINWLAASVTETGVLYVIDGPALRRIDPSGKMTTIAEDLGPNPMGLWPTGEGDVHVAVHGARAIVRVRGSDGHLTTVAHSSAPWAPAGVLVAPDGGLWVLEYSATNAARVRCIAPDGKERLF